MERIIEQKFYDLDIKVTEIQTVVEKLQEEAEERKGKSTTDSFKRVPRGQRSAADQKRSCGYAPHIQELINSKMGTGTYLLDKEHLPIYPDFEDNTVVMDENEPSSVQAQEKKEKARLRKLLRCQLLKRHLRFS